MPVVVNVNVRNERKQWETKEQIQSCRSGVIASVPTGVSNSSQHLPSCPSLSHASSIRGSLFTDLFERSVILGRAIKTEYLALGTLFGTVGLSMGLSGGSKDTKPKTIEQVKESVGLNASSK